MVRIDRKYRLSLSLLSVSSLFELSPILPPHIQPPPPLQQYCMCVRVFYTCAYGCIVYIICMACVYAFVICVCILYYVYICACVYMYVLCVCMYVCMYVHVYICMRVCTYCIIV